MGLRREKVPVRGKEMTATDAYTYYSQTDSHGHDTKA